jgi:hypothetical protein
MLPQFSSARDRVADLPQLRSGHAHHRLTDAELAPLLWRRSALMTCSRICSTALPARCSLAAPSADDETIASSCGVVPRHDR